MSGTDDDAKPVDVISAQAAKGQMDPIPAAFAEVTQRLNTGRDARLALTDRVTTAEGKVSILQTQMAAQQARIIPADQAAAVAAIQAKNTVQDGRLDAVEAKNTTQDTRLAALEANAVRSVVVTIPAGTTNGRVSVTWSPAFATGVVPVVEALPVKPTAATGSYNVALYGDPTNTGCTLEVNVVPPSVTLPALATALLGLVISLFSSGPAGTKVHVTARAPS